MRIPSRAQFGKRARDEVVSFALANRIAHAELDEFTFAVGEALANAIEHSGTGDVIEVHCRIESDKIVATITDSGCGFNPQTGRPFPEVLSERGRGLPIMERCTDIFAVRSAPGKGTAVVLGRYLQRKNS